MSKKVVKGAAKSRVVSSIIAILIGTILALIVWYCVLAPPSKKPDLSLPREIISA